MKSLKKFVVTHSDAFVAGQLTLVLAFATIVWHSRDVLVFSIASAIACIFWGCITFITFREA